MNVLVIGGAGYIGSTLSRDLWREGHSVTVFDSMLFGAESLLDLSNQPRFQVIQGDMRDQQALAQVIPGHDAVCLLAAIVGEPACNRDPDLAVETNLKGTLNVLHGAKEFGVSRFVFSSTCSNYGVADQETLVTEEAPLQPISTYAETKVEAEKAILAEASPNFCPTVLRFSTAYGVSTRMRFDLLVSDFARAAVLEKKIVIFGEQFWRPFAHVNDLSLAVRTTFEAVPEVVSGRVYNVGDNSDNLQKAELGRLIQQYAEGIELEFIERQVDPRSYRVDFSRITDEIGFKAQWSVEKGVREVIDALRSGVWANPMDSRFTN